MKAMVKKKHGFTECEAETLISEAEKNSPNLMSYLVVWNYEGKKTWRKWKKVIEAINSAKSEQRTHFR